jgi:beta-lactamase regulating signal transducer with metallopeptidase domain
MFAAILDHLWQSTLFALAAGLLALVFRRAGAAVRYGLWFAASAKFLVPFAALAAIGRLLAPMGPPPAVAAADRVLVAQVAQPFSQPLPVHPAASFDPTLLLLALWALGCSLVLCVWAVRWARVRTILHSSRPLSWPAPMPVLASPSLMEPGLVGLWRPVLLIPESLPEHLGQAEIDALLAHETSHFRRRDNLTAALHMVVEALFWFHPQVWWIGARLIRERERACDEAVVRAGHDRTAYARSLVESCRLYLQSPLSCVAGASGSHLEIRVAAIMTAPASSPLSAARKILLLTAGLTALATPVAAGWLTSPAGRSTATRAAALVSDYAPSVARPVAQDGEALAPIGVRNSPSVASPSAPAGQTHPLALSSEKLLMRAPEPEQAVDTIALAAVSPAPTPPAQVAYAASEVDGPDPEAVAKARYENEVVCKNYRTMAEWRGTRRCLARSEWNEIERRQRINDTQQFWAGPNPNSAFGQWEFSSPPAPTFTTPTGPAR